MQAAPTSHKWNWRPCYKVIAFAHLSQLVVHCSQRRGRAVTVIGVKQAQYNAFLLLDFGWTTKFDPDNGVETELTAFSLAGACLPIS